METVYNAEMTNEDDFEEEDCLCQGKVPDDKKVDFLRRVFDDKRKKWKNKVLLRYHKDCPIHGIKVTYASRTEPPTVQSD